MINYKLATPGVRFIARLIDSLLSLTFLFLEFTILPIFFRIPFLKEHRDDDIVRLILYIIILVPILYFFCADGLKGGQSYGKRIRIYV
jgi:uncharacterized RDD family membrane protein YckC